jgi:hypothetical protein
MSSAGTPKMPLPMILLIISPVSAHRPIARMSGISILRADELFDTGAPGRLQTETIYE